MLGQYTFFVAKGLPTNASAQVSICTVGVFGTRYVRSETLTTNFVITAGSQAVLTVQDVYAEDTIADTLSISTRQKTSSTLSFVTLVNSALSTDVTINASSLPARAAPYSLVLESTDDYSALPSLVLKTDTVNIYVTTYDRIF